MASCLSSSLLHAPKFEILSGGQRACTQPGLEGAARVTHLCSLNCALAERLESSVKAVLCLALDGVWCLGHSSGERPFGAQIPASLDRGDVTSG